MLSDVDDEEEGWGEADEAFADPTRRGSNRREAGASQSSEGE